MGFGRDGVCEEVRLNLPTAPQNLHRCNLLDYGGGCGVVRDRKNKSAEGNASMYGSGSSLQRLMAVRT